MKWNILLVSVAILVFSGYASSSVGRRRNPKPPSSYGRPTYGQEQDFGQSQDFQTSNDNWGTGQQSNLDVEEDDGGIQQVRRDDDVEDFSNLLQQSSRNQDGGDKLPPPKYTQEETSEQIQYSSTPEAITPVGTFRGLKTIVNGTVVYKFYGIPYAKPPVGSLRFKRPIPADKLNEPYDATHLPNACPQTLPEVFSGFSGEDMWAPNTDISEDCLYLNIIVPGSVFEKKETELVPVMSWIYGGGFFSGSISLDVYNGEILAATQGIIVVSVQYRLGPHGFLYFGTDDAPGNMGMIDQSLGLRWTRENIEYFGGNPNSITLAGESCGAASVGFHLVSPLSKSYIKRGMMTSGLPTELYAFKSPDELKSRSYKFAKLAGCKQDNISDIVECLRKVDSDKLTALQWKVYKNLLDFPFSVTVDGYFLPDHPHNIIKNGKAKRADLILGTVQDEGTYFILYHYLNYFSHRKPTSVPYDRYVDIMTELFQDYSEAEREAIIDEYTNWENPEDGYANQRKIGEAVGDAWFTCPHRQFADEWANRGLSVYYYHFSKRFVSNPWAKWMGVMHGDDIGLLFGSPFTNHTHTLEEEKMSLKFMEMAGNFFKVGVPSNKWERYTSEHPVYLDVNSTIVTGTSTENLHGPKARECAFWNKILPLISKSEKECVKKGHVAKGQQFGSQRQQQEVPQWNPNGEGIHGGQGFHYNNMQQPGQANPQFAPHPSAPMFFVPHSYYAPPPPHQGQTFGSQGCHAPPQTTMATPTEKTSCQCTVQEAGSDNEATQPRPFF